MKTGSGNAIVELRGGRLMEGLLQGVVTGLCLARVSIIRRLRMFWRTMKVLSFLIYCRLGDIQRAEFQGVFRFFRGDITKEIRFRQVWLFSREH